jgi:hypothetical protein
MRDDAKRDNIIMRDDASSLQVTPEKGTAARCKGERTCIITHHHRA